MTKMHTILAEIASDNSKLHKLAVIAREATANNTEFFAGLRFAFDNIDSFGVKKVPERTGADGPGLDAAAFAVLANKLIKRVVTGGAATLAINAAMAQASNAEWNGWYRLILVKDLSSGFSESSVNKAVKGINDAFAIPVTPYMRCSLPASSNMEDWTWEDGIYSQLKADGMFANVNVRNDGFVWITSRSGSLFREGALGIEVEVARVLRGETQTHGELTVYQDGVLLDRQTGNGILNSVLNGGVLEANQVVVYDAWDQIPLANAVSKGEYKVKYKVRFADLASQIASAKDNKSVLLSETKVVFSEEEAKEHYREMRRRKLEGTINKSGDMVWKDGTSKDQVKFKESVDVELRIMGFSEGKGKNKNLFGSLTCQTEDGLLECGVSGISDKLRNEIHNNRAAWLHGIITARSNSIMFNKKPGKLHSLFLPRMVEARLDKTVADTFQSVCDQFAAAEQAAGVSAAEVE